MYNYNWIITIEQLQSQFLKYLCYKVNSVQDFRHSVLFEYSLNQRFCKRLYVEAQLCNNELVPSTDDAWIELVSCFEITKSQYQCTNGQIVLSVWNKYQLLKCKFYCKASIVNFLSVNFASIDELGVKCVSYHPFGIARACIRCCVVNIDLCMKVIMSGRNVFFYEKFCS